MRCPKCGYISFDRQRSCGKCNNDLTAVAGQLQGTAGMAAAPFFLGPVLGEKTPSHAEPAPILHEEEALDLDEFETAALPTDEEDLDFAGPPLSEDDLEDQPLPPLNLEDIDVSDLVPPQEEKEELVLPLGSEQEEEPVLSLGNEQREELVLSLESEQEEAMQHSAQDEDASLMGLEMPSLETDDLLSLDEKKGSPRDSFEDETPDFRGSDEEEGDEIVDLSSLMNFDEPVPDAEKDQDFLGLSFEDEPDELHLTLDDGEDDSAPAEAPEKPRSAMADIPDLGLTLENDDQ